MTKWPRFGNCKTRLSKDIGKRNALIIQQKMLFHTLAVAKFLAKKDILEISIAINGIGFKKCKRWCIEQGIKNFSFQGKGCLGEKIKRQISIHGKSFDKLHKPSLIIIGTDLPNLCHLDILETISKLKKSDIVLGPANDGGYWLIAFSKKFISDNLYLPFINIPWSTNIVLERTIKNLINKDIKIDYLKSKVDIDTIQDLE